ncbi:MAG TPA: hypothetical protein VER04_03510, partial [Polyangiaceae bacterium]|nr:hypothetical protein [Polyangiaceae bacterium]
MPSRARTFAPRARVLGAHQRASASGTAHSLIEKSFCAKPWLSKKPLVPSSSAKPRAPSGFFGVDVTPVAEHRQALPGFVEHSLLPVAIDEQATLARADAHGLVAGHVVRQHQPVPDPGRCRHAAGP